jgi:hypothetical protein
MKNRFGPITLLLSLGAIPTLAQNAPTAPPPAAPITVAPSNKGWQFTGSLRLRVEDYRWFDITKADGAYSFLGALLRMGLSRQTSRDETVLEPGISNGLWCQLQFAQPGFGQTRNRSGSASQIQVIQGCGGQGALPCWFQIPLCQHDDRGSDLLAQGTELELQQFH